ncbi:tripartite tricarboxylate transporter TctB family protein [Enterovirga aerilata]|uniref:Tripartite tricarboxylate transporter TctB family protein n=1 Tax=Enterovirga aerilata TaxID=2730920 RepID=A0A849IAI9_9HYPH|nr:tripartite tricarboxylate transporter TctB family protein [Enterovirga sp. DB1703]NNM74904.1 tripartite tricarboxylate transporter TctB family protein [Enterovirga sp. DB1703]
MVISDRITGAVIAALGAAAAYAGSRLPPVPGQQVGPSAFPTVIGLGLVVCGVLVALGIGRSFEDEAEADVAASEEAKGLEHVPPARLSWLRAAIPPGLLLFYVYAVDALGFVPTAAVMILALALAFRGSLRVALPMAVLGPILVHLLFYKLLRVPLPPGLVPMPW